MCARAKGSVYLYELSYIIFRFLITDIAIALLTYTYIFHLFIKIVPIIGMSEGKIKDVRVDIILRVLY